jgi:outer membrane protein TolC
MMGCFRRCRPALSTSLCLLALRAFSAELLPERVLTLEDSVKLAVNNSQQMLMLQEDENIALQRVRESESLLFPKLDFNANWSKFRVQGDKPLLLQPAMGPTLITNSPAENFYTARANIYQTVYEGGRSRNTWRQARISYERAKSADEAIRIQVAGVAKEAFYDLLLAQEKRRDYEEVLRRLESLYRRPPSASLDGIRVEDGLSKLQAESTQAALAEEQARLSYLQALNLELNTNVSLKGELSTQPVELDLQKLLAWAGQYRAELRQTEYQEELDALGISLSLAERTPTVGFGASYERTGNDISVDRTADWAGTLNINVPLSVADLFFGRSKVRERKAQYRQATLKHSETSDQIQLQVRQAYSKYRFWQQELAPRENQYRRARSLAETLRGRNSPALERLEGERLLMETHLRYREAVHGHLAALSALERAVGHDILSER